MQVAIELLRAHLQQPMGPPLRPAHLLLFHEPLSD
jgi:hypothetical protein